VDQASIFLTCSMEEWEAKADKEGLRKGRLLCIQLKQLWKTFITGKQVKSLLVETESVLNVKEREEKELTKNALDAKAKEWLLKCRCSGQECILRGLLHAMIVEAKEKKSVIRIGAKLVLELKLLRKRKLLNVKLIRGHLMVKSMFSTVKLTNAQELNLEM